MGTPHQWLQSLGALVCVCLCLGRGEARMHTYFVQDQQFKDNYAQSIQFLLLPNHLHHQSPTHPVPITAHHSTPHPPPPPHLPSVLESAHYAVYTCVCIQSKLYAKSDLFTYTSIHVFVCVYNTWDKLLQQEKLVPAIFASKLPLWRPVVARRYEDDILKLSL